jgi:hypothetical protein
VDIKPIFLANDSAQVYATSAVWSPDDNQLVACQIAVTAQELLKAIKATLAKNSGNNALSLRGAGIDETTMVQGARRGFLSVSASLQKVHAEGNVTVLLHPLAGNPQESAEDYFYLVVTRGQDPVRLFYERLELAIPWPLQPDWAGMLIDAGQYNGLVVSLPMAGDDFQVAFRIKKDEDSWCKIIAQLLLNGQVSIPQSNHSVKERVYRWLV